jgi:hypothetical protein
MFAVAHSYVDSTPRQPRHQMGGPCVQLMIQLLTETDELSRTVVAARAAVLFRDFVWSVVCKRTGLVRLDATRWDFTYSSPGGGHATREHDHGAIVEAPEIFEHNIARYVNTLCVSG